ncbi:MAG: GNAT family N-acetyltransferase [Deltaproteobacteria bacterium]|nr:GNAT family N-acetyltransferase [Deltaproteobacteria bacterium]
MTVVTATRSTQTIGLILAVSHPDGDSVEVLSLFVALEHRRQGLGLTLLTTLENILANKNCNRLNLVYQTNWPDIAAIEGLLQKSGWSLPQTHMLLCKTTATQISKAPWLQKTYNLPNPLTIFPWANLTLVERQTLQHQQAKPWFPPILTPFQEEDKVEWLNSLGLRTQHQIVGWMITHRLKPDTIQYSALFVRPPYQNLGAGTFLLVEAIRRQFVADIPKGVFMINIKDKAMLTFMQRRLQPYLTALAESRQVSKQLQHP